MTNARSQESVVRSQKSGVSSQNFPPSDSCLLSPESCSTPSYQRGSVSASREQTNPLRSLTISRAISFMESAQRGEFLELQWLYWFIEQTEPVLIALQERRYGRLTEMDWQIKTIPKQRRRASFDEGLAAEQTAVLAETYDRIDNIKEAIEHLASATFRLYAHLNIQRDPAGDIVHLEPLDQWNFLRNGMFGDWYWNPDAVVTSWRQLPAGNRIVPEDFVIRTVARHIDRPGLIKQIRKNLGEKDWSGFLEIYGIPTPAIIMPTGAKESDKSLYEAAGKAIAEGRAVALPSGSDAKFPGEVRGNAPFKEYLDWCDAQMVLVGTGGLLSMLAMPTGLGSGASETHDAAFQSIAKAEAYRISELFQRRLDKAILAAAFPGEPVLAYFEIAAQDSTDPGIILDHAVKARNAGLQMDPAELSEMTGYQLGLQPPPAIPTSPFVPGTPSVTVHSPTTQPDPSPVLNSEPSRIPSPLDPLLAELEKLVDAGDPDEIQAWIDDLPKRAAALDLAGDAETLARAMETAAVSALLEAKPKLDQAKVGLESGK
jgi:phage gp29-like protein